MTRQNISTGTTANDGTGDTLRSAGTKINENFVEIYQAFGTDSNSLASGITFDSSKIVIAGTTNTTTITRFDPSSNVTFKIPDSNGEAVIINDNNIVNLVDSTGTASKIYFANVFDSAGLFPSATTYHGMFAHSHNNGRAAFAHAGVWHNLLDSDTFTSITGLQLINPKIDTHIFDNTGNFEILNLDNTSGSPINNIKISNALTTTNPTITTEGGDTNIGLTLSAKGTGSVQINKAAYSSSTITANGAASTTATYIICNKGTALAVSLADGTTVGEYKIFSNKGAGTATITPTNFAAGTSFAIAQNEGAQCIWDGTNWFLIGNQSVTTVV